LVLTVQFEGLRELLGPHIGILWDESFREAFPKVEHHPPIEQVLELERAVSAEPKIRLSTEPALPRFFFINERGTELVQVQTDRLSYNWRSRAGEYDYPRYPAVRASFEGAMLKLREFVEREKLGEIAPNQCEFLYANSILYSATELPHRNLGKLIEPWATDYQSLAGADLEDVSIHARHVLRGEDGRFIGRMHVTVQPGYLVADRTPTYKVQFTARGLPLDPSISGAFEFLDLAHSRLRTAFSELISQDVQQRWMSEHGNRNRL
jgi:uncharacterized protein (TIGR04255 family)